MDSTDSYQFQGSERFEVRGFLGSGGFGEVLKVYDHRLKSTVALKTLHRAEPAALYRFKQEFRALADIAHPNLVQLYELLSEDGQWFFTMELIEGREFRRFVNGAGPPPAPAAERDFDRLRHCFRQLAVGLATLHRAGKLHRDVKPSNILVTEEGRLVLLDFGLVTARPRVGHPDSSVDGRLVGTPAYMAPEQAAGRRAIAASDWYAAGVILFEALTGERPFSGSMLSVLRDKQRRPAPSPSELAPGLPHDLRELCVGLLECDPEARFGVEAVLERLGPAPTVAVHQIPVDTGDVPFVGREQQLEDFAEAFAASRRGTAAIVVVEGSSGIGKTALVRRFVTEARREHGDVVFLKGRCYERESVPYKALDALMDALCTYLMHLPEEEVEALLPAHVLSLARVFPALSRLDAVARARRHAHAVADHQEQRRRAQVALRELLTRLAERRPMVLTIDDLQWGDRESAELVSELLQPPDPPPLMLILCCRREERRASVFLEQLFGDRRRGDKPGRNLQGDDRPPAGDRRRRDRPRLEGVAVREVAVDELSTQDAAELALTQLGERAATGRSRQARDLAQKIAVESGGSPFFVAELVRYAAAEHGTVDAGGAMTLANLLDSRLRQLPARARRLLAVVAAAGRPLDLDVALEVAQPAQEAQALLAGLSSVKLVRVRGSVGPATSASATSAAASGLSSSGRATAWATTLATGFATELETYHDRIREFVVSTLDETWLKDCHRRLALALEAAGKTDYETLASHYREAGDHEAEGRFLVAAAERAGRALAFDRAARLYRRALTLEIHAATTRRRLSVALGHALRDAGRGAAAAEAYLAAVPGAGEAEVIDLLGRSAEQQLLSGHIDDGLRTLRRVLASVGLKMPSSRAMAALSAAWRRLQLWSRGLEFTATAVERVPREELTRLDVCRSVATGLALVDPLLGMDFATRTLLLALESGVPDRIARALAIEAGFSSAGGTRTRERTDRLLRMVKTLAEQSGSPYALGLAEEATGLAAYLAGRGRQALEVFDRAETILRERCTGVAWEIGSLMHFRYRLLVFQGQLRRVSDELPAILKDFRARGDLYSEASLRGAAAWTVRLAADEPAEAEAEIRRSRDSWPQQGFHLQHYLQLVGRVEIALYRGDGDAAWSALEETWPAVVRSQLLRIVELTRTEALHLRCRGALAGAAALGPASSRGRKALRVLRRTLRRLARQESPWAAPFAQQIEASLAAFEGRRQQAVRYLEQAAAGFEAADMGLYAAVSRRRWGELAGDLEGQRRAEEAEAWMRAQKIENVERMTNALAPGSWDR